jgi:hypothetical protein
MAGMIGSIRTAEIPGPAKVATIDSGNRRLGSTEPHDFGPKWGPIVNREEPVSLPQQPELPTVPTVRPLILTTGTTILPDSPPPDLTDEERAEIEDRKFQEAIAGLPNNATPAAEIAWIRSHPAMIRSARQPNKMKAVAITAADVTDMPCGVAPSRSAVFNLQHWANYPHEFFKQVLSQDKKADQESKDPNREDVGIKEVKRLLALIQSREHVDDEDDD